MKTLLVLLLSVRAFALVPVVITDQTASTQTNRPIKIPMMFKQGDIANFPHPTIGGVPATTWQTAVRTRWPDGSAQETLTAILATVPASGSITVDFQNDTNPCSSGNAAACLAAGLNIAAMQAFNGTPGWNVEIDTVASSITKTFNARTILNSCGSISSDPATLGCRYWMVGPVMTSVILEDRDTTRAYDAGYSCTANCTYPYASATWISDTTNKSLHPIFNVEFWAGTSNIEYRAIALENMWTTHFQDQAFALTIKTGAALGTTAYTKAYFTEFGLNRWRKSFWDGTAPGTVKMNLNFPYMISTGAIPNFDTSYTPSSAADNALWLTTDKCDINGRGWFNFNLGDPGGRNELALIPGWYVRGIYSWDPTAIQNILTSSDCFGSAQVNVRESQTGLFFDSAHTVAAFGRPYSVDAHPNNRIRDLTAVGSYTTGQTGFVNWQTAHEAAYSYIPFLLSGDWYTLESLQLQLAADIQDTDPTTQAYGRNAAMGLINGRAQQLRGQAWGWRDLIEGTVLSVDASPEKNYFTQKLNNNIGAWEGWYNITNGQFFNSTAWLFGRNIEAVSDPNPLRFPQWPDQSAQFFNWINSTVQWVESPLEFHFLTVAVGHMVDLGYPFTAVQQVFAAVPVNTVLNPGFNPWLIGAYRIPEFFNSNQFHFATTWPQVLTGYALSPTNYQTINNWPVQDQTDCVSGFTHYALAATSYLANITLLSVDGGYNGRSAYNFVNDPARGVSNAACLASNPMWAFLPRGAAQCTISPGTLPGGTLNTSYSQTLNANNCGPGPFTWSVVGSLPPGLTGCSGTSCTISGSPSTVTGSPFSFSVKVVGSSTATQPYSITVGPGVATFDYNITASGPTHVTRGRFMAFLVTGAVTVGTDEGATPVVTGLPAGATVTYVNLIKFCCTTTTPGINGNLNPVQVNTTGTTPPGTYNLTITYTSTVSHVIRATTWPLVVDPPPSPIVPATFPADVPLTGLATWQANMLSFGATYCNNMQGPAFEGFAWYYDGTRNFYQISDYTGDTATWLPCARLFDTAYRNYVLQTPPTWTGTAGNIPGWHAFPLGLSMGFTRDAVAADKTAILALQNNGYATVQNIAFVIDFLSSREMSYGLETNLVAESLGVARVPTFQQVAEILIGHFDQWFLTRNAQYVQPFMVALASEALINYYNATGDLRVPPLLKVVADQLWAVSFDPLSNSMLYYNFNQSQGAPPPAPYPYDPQCSNKPSLSVTCQGPSPDLNLLIAPLFGWVYQQTGLQVYRDHGDILFNAGVSGAFLGAGKQFTQNYRWSADYVRWRNAPVAPPTGTCDLNHDFTTNVLDVQLVTNMGLNTVACTANINGLNTCNIVTVQRVINAALGGACQLGP